MTQVFGDYANYYDDFYQEKDYAAECDYALSLIREHSSHPVSTLLDLGCGTGTHALKWAASGLKVTGVDLSSVMLDQARKKAVESRLQTEFVHSDIRTLKLNRRFDAVTSMFAVMGYQTTNDDLERALQVAREHINPGGIFLFDSWYGPAVITQKPESREKRFKKASGKGEIVRKVQSDLDILNHVVTVHYTLNVDGETKSDQPIKESHRMRYFFPQEIAYFLAKTGFESCGLLPFMELGGSPSADTWNVTFLARAIGK